MYTLEITNSAKKELLEVTPIYQEKIRQAIRLLPGEPRPHGCLKLKGFTDLYRIRIADYRVIYAIDDVNKKISIRKVSHRSSAY